MTLKQSGSLKAVKPISATPENPVEIKRREVELGSHSWMDCLLAELMDYLVAE